jgi:hypothetical protein
MQADDPAEDAAHALYQESTDAISKAMTRFEGSVRTSDINRMRAIFQDVDGYLLGLNNTHGHLETILIEEALRTRMDLNMLWVFFKELRVGRYLVDPAFNVCVFSIVIRIDDLITHERVHNPEFAAQHIARVAEVVHYMVNALGMPVPRDRPFRLHVNSLERPLLELALLVGAWASYAALVPHVQTDANETHMLPRLIRHRHARSLYSIYCLTRLLPHATDEQLEALLQAQRDNPHLVAEAQHRTQTRQQMRALTLMPRPGAPGNGVLDNDYLSQLIHQEATKDHRF